MKTLILLRHAKSDWSDALASDHARPLNERGIAAAEAMGAYMTRKRYSPELILCSTARRTVQTLDLIRPNLNGDIQVRYEDTLYLATQRQILERIRWIDESVKCAMIVGHNPGLEQIARGLVRKPKTQPERVRFERLSEKFSTCALAVTRFAAGRWKDVEDGAGALADYVRPKDLDGVQSD
jgi:phosphohistidine phosphatase